MLRRPRRTRRPTSLAVLLVLATALAGCGEDDGAPDEAERLDAVEVTGDVGASPTVDWKSRMTAGKPETETLVDGEGAELKKGDKVFVNYWLGNGSTEQTTFDSFGPQYVGFQLTVGEDYTQVQSVADTVAVFLSSQIKAGVTRGSRLAFTASAAEMFGQFLGSQEAAPLFAQEDIGTQDSFLVIADVLDTEVLAAPDGTAQPPPAWAPKVVLAKNEPSRLDFTGTPKPSKNLRVGALIQGTGEEVEKGDLIVVNYLGAVYQGKTPFDESFSKPEPLITPIGLQRVVKGWDRGLVGQKVGSRVMLGIPPALGYGKQGSGEAVPPNSTLYFVVDLLAAA